LENCGTTASHSHRVKIFSPQNASLLLSSYLLSSMRLPVSSSLVTNLTGCDWRVALCITSGCVDMENTICVFDGVSLSHQLDARCRELLSTLAKIDLSPPSLLYSTPSITLPRALSCLLPACIPASAYENSASGSTSTLAYLDDVKKWLNVLHDYLSIEQRKNLDKLLSQHNKIYPLFAVQDFSRFKFLKLLGDPYDSDGSEEMDAEERLTMDTPAVSASVSVVSPPASAPLCRPDTPDELIETHSNATPTSEYVDDPQPTAARSASLDTALLRREASAADPPPDPTSDKAALFNSQSVSTNIDQPQNLSISSTPRQSELRGRPPIASHPSRRVPIQELRAALTADPQNLGSKGNKGKRYSMFHWKAAS
jgi:hypothetical protein